MAQQADAATLQVECQAALPEGQGQEEAHGELRRTDSERIEPEHRRQQGEEETQGEEAHGRAEEAHRKGHPKICRPSPLATSAGIGASTCPTGGDSTGDGPSTTAIGGEGSGGEGGKGVESALTPPKPRPRRGKKPKFGSLPPAADHGDWPDLPKAAGGVLCSTPNMCNATVVGEQCPIASMSSQQGTCCTLSGRDGSHPHFANETSSSSKIVAVQAEFKLRELKASLAMHLQLIREKYDLPCVELAFQVAELDLSRADAACLEESIQAARRILLS